MKMKKFLSIAFVAAFLSSSAVYAAESRIENYVNNLISPITQKEKELNAQAEAQQKARERQQKQRQRELKRKQRELKRQQREAQQRRENTRNAIEAEASFWKSLFNKD